MQSPAEHKSPFRHVNIYDVGRRDLWPGRAMKYITYMENNFEQGHRGKGWDALASPSNYMHDSLRCTGGGLFSISLFIFKGGGIVAFSVDILGSMGQLLFLIFTLLVHFAGWARMAMWCFYPRTPRFSC